ncbi:MAG TPA: hypothetical protein VH619_01750 [Verrucomicrobiae bacterium]|nr:hypothetical protein [Verrucomicrobiae bacterium]
MDAYLWAEQYGWLAYDDAALKDSQFIDYPTSFYLAHDLHWFSRLLTAVAADIKRCIDYATDTKPGATHETLLQTWRNTRLDTKDDDTTKKGARWLEGTRFLERAKERKAKKSKKGDSMPSIRVSAVKINKKRRGI